MKRLRIFLLLFAAAASAVAAAAELLVFNETTGLPGCAYACSALYNAQYECPPSGPEQVECFCASRFVGWEGEREGWNGCGGACTDEVGRGRVGAWMESLCGSREDDVGDKPDGDGDDDNGHIIIEVDPTMIENDAAEKAAAHAAKAKDWWRRNYPFFILAFLVVTIPIVSYAIAIPLRKWCKKQLIRRRPRSQAHMEDVGPYRSVFTSRYGDHQYAPATPGGIPEHTIAIPPEASVRQDSWEARVRDQFQARKSLGARMKFWSK